MSKTFWAIIAVIVIVFGGILLFNDKDAGAPSGNNSAKPTEHIEGEGKSGLTLVEYGDYQCPFCGQFYPAVKQVQAKYKDQVKFQFRNLPLLQIHKNAFSAARAAEAAGLQGKFWEMHDILYENQSAWSENSNAQAIFESYASSLGLKAAQFKNDMASSKVNDMINADVSAFNKTGVEKSTPTFFLNGKRVQPAGYTVEDFAKILDPAIKKAEQNKQ
ncbi:MAG TPA: thioredoxin domain-containing protein [Candidatus Saccharimonadales bacterium]|nr:thioredoxin domain-containing protein [Candidatus Saccharimonadales bacterium]